MEIETVLTRAVAQVEKEADLRRLLEHGGRAGKPLRVKLGFDPSKPDLTLGHGVVLRKLRQFQDMGHTAVVIVGDWTAQLGDPTGKEGAREPLSEAEVRANAATYLDQFFSIVDKSKTEVRWQSEWFNAFTLADVFRLGYQKTVAQMLKRDHFEKRFVAGNEIYLSEFLYPLLQGYDSIAVEADVELGGTDQTYNLLVGRELQERHGMPPQQILTCHLIVGLDGTQKMSKSLGNYITLTAEPNDMYGKLMSLPDDAMEPYFEGLTYVPTQELHAFAVKMRAGTVNPRDVKMRLAREVVTEFHDATAAAAAEAAFKRQFQGNEWPTEMPTYPLNEPTSILTLLLEAKLIPSKSAGRTLIAQGGVYLRPQGADGPTERITDATTVIAAQAGAELRVGKLKFLRIVTP
ncbi:MAG: tyrosine--tRNA ligase [Ktedonobacterales bacterium]|nr:tyrosine--tRNA ligase [Ktedonobacterales bacterium]